jgi:hypothetical protein
MKYLIKSKKAYPNSFIIEKERIVFMAFEERLLPINVAAKYPDHLVLLETINENEKVVPVIQMITEPAPIIPIKEIIDGELIDLMKNADEVEETLVMITEPNETMEIALEEAKSASKTKTKKKKTK